MQIQTSNNAFPTFRPVVSSPSNTGAIATSLADPAPPASAANETSTRRGQFGDALLRRIDAGDLRGTRNHGREFRFGRSLVQRTRHEATDALRDGAKDLLKGVKKELRSALRELGDDKETRKEVRSLYKDFRRDVKDIVKSTRSSRQFDTGEIAADLESAFSSFTAGLRDALSSGPRTDSVPYEATSLTDPANDSSVVANDRPNSDNVPPPASVAETRNANTPPASVAETRNTNTPPASVAETRNTNTPPASVAETRTETVPPPNENGAPPNETVPPPNENGAPPNENGLPPRENEPPPASVAETASTRRPDLDGLFSGLDSVFKGGLSKIVDGINAALERANEAFERFRSRNSGGGHHGGFGSGRFVDRAA